MSISDKYFGFLQVSQEYRIYFQASATNIRLLGSFNNEKFFNTETKNKIFGHRFWMPTHSGIVLLLLTIALCAVLHKSRKTSKNISVGILLFNILLVLLKLPFLLILILLCGDVEINPGKPSFNRVFLFVTEISIVYLRIILPKYFSLKHM